MSTFLCGVALGEGTHLINSIYTRHPYITRRRVEVDVDVWIRYAHNLLVLKHLVGHSRFEGGAHLHEASRTVLAFHGSHCMLIGADQRPP